MYHLLETLLANTTTLVLVIVLGFVLLTRWREKEVIRTDTVHLESTRTDTIPVRYVPSFFKYCTQPLQSLSSWLSFSALHGGSINIFCSFFFD
jgi:hypothetical protein